MTSVNIKYPVQKEVEATCEKHDIKESLSAFTHTAMLERIDRLNGGVPDAE